MDYVAGLGRVQPHPQSPQVSRPRFSERTALIIRFRRACPGSERTSDGYIERPITPPFPRKWGRVASGGLAAASCIPDRDKEIVQLYTFGFQVISAISVVTSSKSRRLPL